MKKLFLLLTFVCLCAVASAQVNLTVKAGTTLNGWTPSTDYDAKFGYRVGVGVDFGLSKHWGLQTGLELLNRREGLHKEKYVEDVAQGYDLKSHIDIKSKINAMYLHLPVKVVYNIPFNQNSGLALSAGVYVECGIAGKVKNTVDVVTKHVNSNVTLPENIYNEYNGKETGKSDTFSKDNLKRMDVGLSLGVDYGYKNLFIGVSGEYGLIPVHKDLQKTIFLTDGGDMKTVSPHNLAVELHIGYRFCLGKK